MEDEHMNQEIDVHAIEAARRVALEQNIAHRSDEYDRGAQDQAERLTRTELDKTQVRGLETLAYTTDKVSDVTDWLKTRVGRDGRRDRWAREGIGREILTTLERLRKDAREIVMTLKQTHPLPNEDPDLERRVHLQLIREYLKHLAAHFEYRKAEESG
jgi:hypothetical protein